MIGYTFHGGVLKAARRRARISQKRFAAEVGCHISTVVRSETGGPKYVSIEMVQRFVDTANQLGITIDGRPVVVDDLVSVDLCPVCAVRVSA